MPEPQTITQYGVTRPMTAAERIAEKMKTMPRINVTTGRPLPVEDQPPSVQAAATVQGQPYTSPVPNLGDAIVAVAGAHRLDPVALLADEAFVAAIADLAATDLEGIERAVMASSVKPAASGMRPNPAQGRSASTPVTAPETPLDKLRRATTNSRTGGAVTNLI